MTSSDDLLGGTLHDDGEFEDYFTKFEDPGTYEQVLFINGRPQYFDDVRRLVIIKHKNIEKMCILRLFLRDKFIKRILLLSLKCFKSNIKYHLMIVFLLINKNFTS